MLCTWCVHWPLPHDTCPTAARSRGPPHNTVSTHVVSLVLDMSHIHALVLLFHSKQGLQLDMHVRRPQPTCTADSVCVTVMQKKAVCCPRLTIQWNQTCGRHLHVHEHTGSALSAAFCHRHKEQGLHLGSSGSPSSLGGSVIWPQDCMSNTICMSDLQNTTSCNLNIRRGSWH